MIWKLIANSAAKSWSEIVGDVNPAGALETFKFTISSRGGALAVTQKIT